MTTPIAENPAAINPRAHLTPAQRDALVCIGHYRRQIENGRTIIIGRKRFSPSTIASLEEKELVRGRLPNLAPTTGGELAIERLKGGH